MDREAEVMTPEPHRNPLCQRPSSATSSMEFVDRQAREILELKGRLEAAAGREHKANNRIQAAEGALEMLAPLFGLPESATPRQVVEAALSRLK